MVEVLAVDVVELEEVDDARCVVVVRCVEVVVDGAVVVVVGAVVLVVVDAVVLDVDAVVVVVEVSAPTSPRDAMSAIPIETVKTAAPSATTADERLDTPGTLDGVVPDPRSSPSNAGR